MQGLKYEHIEYGRKLRCLTHIDTQAFSMADMVMQTSGKWVDFSLNVIETTC